MSFITKNFLLIALLASLIALIEPSIFTWAGTYISILLGLIMFGMGLTLTVKDFKDVFSNKKLIFIGVGLQFLIMPLSAFIIGKSLPISEEVFVGLIIVGACPGGTASNVMVYLAKGNVALSIVLTFCSTLLAPILTPFIIYIFAGEQINVSYWSLFQSLLQIVLFPLIAGLIIKHYWGNKTDKYLNFFPAFSSLCITLIIAAVMALNQKFLLQFPYMVFIAVIIHNLSGLFLGYYAGRLFNYNEKDSRTIAIEVGMQNSGLGVALANQFFTPLSALPAAIFSLWHNVSGIILARFWSKRNKEKY